MRYIWSFHYAVLSTTVLKLQILMMIMKVKIKSQYFCFLDCNRASNLFFLGNYVMITGHFKVK